MWIVYKLDRERDRDVREVTKVSPEAAALNIILFIHINYVLENDCGDKPKYVQQSGFINLIVFSVISICRVECVRGGGRAMNIKMK